MKEIDLKSETDISIAIKCKRIAHDVNYWRLPRESRAYDKSSIKYMELAMKRVGKNTAAGLIVRQAIHSVRFFAA